MAKRPGPAAPYQGDAAEGDKTGGRQGRPDDVRESRAGAFDVPHLDRAHQSVPDTHQSMPGDGNVGAAHDEAIKSAGKSVG